MSLHLIQCRPHIIMSCINLLLISCSGWIKKKKSERNTYTSMCKKLSADLPQRLCEKNLNTTLYERMLFQHLPVNFLFIA